MGNKSEDVQVTTEGIGFFMSAASFILNMFLPAKQWLDSLCWRPGASAGTRFSFVTWTCWEASHSLFIVQSFWQKGAFQHCLTHLIAPKLPLATLFIPHDDITLQGNSSWRHAGGKKAVTAVPKVLSIVGATLESFRVGGVKVVDNNNLPETYIACFLLTNSPNLIAATLIIIFPSLCSIAWFQ